MPCYSAGIRDRFLGSDSLFSFIIMIHLFEKAAEADLRKMQFVGNIAKMEVDFFGLTHFCYTTKTENLITSRLSDLSYPQKLGSNI